MDPLLITNPPETRSDSLSPDVVLAKNFPHEQETQPYTPSFTRSSSPDNHIIELSDNTKPMLSTPQIANISLEKVEASDGHELPSTHSDDMDFDEWEHETQCLAFSHEKPDPGNENKKWVPTAEDIEIAEAEYPHFTGHYRSRGEANFDPHLEPVNEEDSEDTCYDPSDFDEHADESKRLAWSREDHYPSDDEESWVSSAEEGWEEAGDMQLDPCCVLLPSSPAIGAVQGDDHISYIGVEEIDLPTDHSQHPLRMVVEKKWNIDPMFHVEQDKIADPKCGTYDPEPLHLGHREGWWETDSESEDD